MKQNQSSPLDFLIEASACNLRFLKVDGTTRLLRGYTINQLAEQVGVSAVSIYNWENGAVRPRETNLSALCRALRLPIRATREMAGA